jgi:hypothetical protein
MRIEASHTSQPRLRRSDPSLYASVASVCEGADVPHTAYSAKAALASSVVEALMA